VLVGTSAEGGSGGACLLLLALPDFKTYFRFCMAHDFAQVCQRVGDAHDVLVVPAFFVGPSVFAGACVRVWGTPVRLGCAAFRDRPGDLGKKVSSCTPLYTRGEVPPRRRREGPM
jgi:hypothetical protein